MAHFLKSKLKNLIKPVALDIPLLEQLDWGNESDQRRADRVGLEVCPGRTLGPRSLLGIAPKSDKINQM